VESKPKKGESPKASLMDEEADEDDDDEDDDGEDDDDEVRTFLSLLVRWKSSCYRQVMLPVSI
jgi:hypothetical protein